MGKTSCGSSCEINLGFALMGRAMFSKSLIYLSVEGGAVPPLLSVVCPEGKLW